MVLFFHKQKQTAMQITSDEHAPPKDARPMMSRCCKSTCSHPSRLSQIFDGCHNMPNAARMQFHKCLKMTTFTPWFGKKKQKKKEAASKSLRVSKWSGEEKTHSQ